MDPRVRGVQRMLLAAFALANVKPGPPKPTWTSKRSVLVIAGALRFASPAKDPKIVVHSEIK